MNIFSEIRSNPNLLITSILNPRIISADNHSILQEAIVYNHDLALKIIMLDVDVNHQDNNGSTALHYAISRSYYQLAQKILQKNSNVNVVDNYGNNLLWTACLNPHKNYELIKTLIKMGADMHHKNKAGRSALDFAIQTDNLKLKQTLNS